MTGLSLELYRRCQEALLQCSEFGSDAALRTCFGTAELRLFRNKLPEAGNRGERVAGCLDFCLDKRSADGCPMLPLFLAALASRYEAGDPLHDELGALAELTGQALCPAPQQPPAPAPQEGPPAPVSVDPDDPPIAEIRWLLREAFTAKSLRRFCTDRARFRPVVTAFGPDDSLDDLVDEIVAFCRTRLLWNKLLEEIALYDRPQYDRFRARLEAS